MMRLAICAGALLLSAAHAIAAEGVVLPPTEASKLATQCSRTSPGPVQGTWTPTSAQLHDLESALPAFFRTEAYNRRGFLKMPNMTPEDADRLLEKYVRQYAGFVIGGKKIIYVNAITRWGISDSPGEWRTKAVQICDGGAITFGVEFDPGARKFRHFSFNGQI
jgi:hypothetical protein